MTRICFCTTVSGTIKAFILEFAKFLHEEKGWDISFICNNDQAFKEILPSYIHYYPVKMRRGISLDGVNAIWQMRKIFREHNFDLVQYSTPNASFYASVAAFLAGVSVRLYCQWGMVFVGMSGLKRSVFKLIEKLVCSLSTWIEPDSASNLSFAHRERLYPQNKGSVVGSGSASGVDLAKFDIQKKSKFREEVRKQYRIPEDAYTFGFVGRLNRDKGINELLTAYLRICEKEYNVRLLLVGRDERDPFVTKSLMETVRQSEKCVFTGRVADPERYYAAMDCFVLPSYREGFGMTVIEAEAMGVPVIVTNIPGPIDGMEDGVTGIVVPVKDSHTLEDAMIQLMLNKERSFHYGQNGVQFVKDHFDRKELFQRIYEDRKALIANKGRKKRSDSNPDFS